MCVLYYIVLYWMYYFVIKKLFVLNIFVEIFGKNCFKREKKIKQTRSLTHFLNLIFSDKTCFVKCNVQIKNKIYISWNSLAFYSILEIQSHIFILFVECFVVNEFFFVVRKIFWLPRYQSSERDLVEIIFFQFSCNQLMTST